MSDWRENIILKKQLTSPSVNKEILLFLRDQKFHYHFYSNPPPKAPTFYTCFWEVFRLSLGRTSSILTESFRGFLHSLQRSVRIVPRLSSNASFPILSNFSLIIPPTIRRYTMCVTDSEINNHHRGVPFTQPDEISSVSVHPTSLRLISLLPSNLLLNLFPPGYTIITLYVLSYLTLLCYMIRPYHPPWLNHNDNNNLFIEEYTNFIVPRCEICSSLFLLQLC